MPISNPDVSHPCEEPLLPPPEPSFFLGPIPGALHHPLVILGWQLFSCALAWSFVVVLACNGEIPLSDALASLIHRYPTETTLIATLLATILSATTTWFFHAAVRQAVVPFLLQHVSLFQLCSAIELPKGSFVLNRHHARWTILTLCVVLLGSLTSAWSSIITPITVNLDLQVTGEEFDFGSLAFMNFTGVSSANLQSPQAESEGISFYGSDSILWDVDLITAGVSSVIGRLGYTSIVSLINDAYNISTGGIIPINNPTIPAIRAWSSTTYDVIYPQVTPTSSNYYHRLSSNQTLNQQGLTANVSYRSQNLSDTTSFPYMVLSNSTFNVPGLDPTTSITSWSWNTACSDDVFSHMNNAFTLGSLGPLQFLAGSACHLQSFSGPSNRSFPIAFTVLGDLGFDSQLCEVTPLLTKVQVAYGVGIVNIEKTLSSSTFDQIDPSGMVIYTICRIIAAEIYATQASSIFGNVMLNSINGFAGYMSVNFTDLNWGPIFEDYWRGSLEGMATAVQSSAAFVLNSTQIPANMSLPVNGTMHVTTMGRKFSKLGSLVALLPITTTLLLSVLALLLSRSLQHKARSPPNSADKRIVFDPASIMSIIRASAAGGMSHSLQGLHHSPKSTEDEDARLLFIGLTDDNQIGFVESKTHSRGIPYPTQVGKQDV